MCACTAAVGVYVHGACTNASNALSRAVCALNRHGAHQAPHRARDRRASLAALVVRGHERWVSPRECL